MARGYCQTMGAPLEEYRRKRDFGATQEPEGGPPAGSDEGRRFCIQRHDARALHFDLRVEHEGVLVSWAVPKGLPLHEGPKRLAVRTEDHPLEYLTFEGVIPDGQYGAGLMTVWDSGVYEREPSRDDEWKLRLRGGVLDGEYHLVRTGDRGGKEQWLVFRSGKGPPGPEDPAAAFRALRPMLAATAEAPPPGDDWAVELKWDGFRALALVTSDGTELRSRSGRDLGERFPALTDLRRGILWQEAILDGEVVALGEDGRASFQALQGGRTPVSFVAFDLLYADGRWLVDRPWSHRVARLATGLVPDREPRIRLSDHVRGRGPELLELARSRDLEGIVAKRADAPYRPGRRSDDWVKVKCRQEAVLVIGGWTEGAGSRRHSLGSVLVGEPDGDGLAFRGAVGSGIGPALAEELRERLAGMAAEASPFGPVPRDIARGAHWVRPELRCDVDFAEVTDDGRLRAPVYRGLVEDDEEAREAVDAASPAPPPEPRPDPDEERAPRAEAAAHPPDAPGDEDERIIRDGARQIRLTNLRKVWWPEDGRTKGDALDHYLRVAAVMVPHLAGRPMILKRYPNGITGDFFFQHNLPDGAPDWIATAALSRSGREGDKRSTYVLVEDALALLWVANLGCIDMNPWQSRAGAPDEPTQVLFDLDPSEGVPFAAVCETALMIKTVLDATGLRGYPRTSGASGMHVFVPLTPGHSFDDARRFAGAVGQALRAQRPDLVTLERRVADRGPRVYLDADQNGRGRSIAAVYSIRPRPGAPVATPLRWEEVGPGLDPRGFTPEVVARRVAAEGDLFAPALTDLQDLRGVLSRL